MEVIPERVSGVIGEELPVECLKTTGENFEAIPGEIPLGNFKKYPWRNLWKKNLNF